MRRVRITLVGWQPKFVYLYVFIYIQTHIYIRIYVYICICVCVCVHRYIQPKFVCLRVCVSWSGPVEADVRQTHKTDT